MASLTRIRKSSENLYDEYRIFRKFHDPKGSPSNLFWKYCLPAEALIAIVIISLQLVLIAYIQCSRDWGVAEAICK